MQVKLGKKTEKHGFAFSKEIADLLTKISEELDINKTVIVERGIQLFAEKKGVKE